MNLNEELRTTLVAQSELREAPPVDVTGLLTRAKNRRQRRTTLRVAVVAATVVVVGGGAFGLTHVDRSAPEPAAPPPTNTAPNLRSSTCPEQCLEPGTYQFPLGADGGKTLSGEVTVDADGWESVSYVNRVVRAGNQSVVMLNVYEPAAFAGPRPCIADLTQELVPGATVDDVARRLAYLPQFEAVDGPTAIPAFGHETLHLQIQADRLRCNEATDPDPRTHAQYNLADILGSDGPWSRDSDIDPGRPVLIDFWMLDLGGHTIVVESRQEGHPTSEMIEQLDQVRASLHFIVHD